MCDYSTPRLMVKWGYYGTWWSILEEPSITSLVTDGGLPEPRQLQLQQPDHDAAVDQKACEESRRILPPAGGDRLPLSVSLCWTLLLLWILLRRFSRSVPTVKRRHFRCWLGLPRSARSCL